MIWMEISCDKIVLENVVVTDSAMKKSVTDLNMEKSDIAYEESVPMSKAAEKRHRKIQAKKERIFNKCKGGSNKDENLQGLCWNCNELKSQLDNDTFIEAAIKAGMYLYFKRLFGKIRTVCNRIYLL